MCPSVVLFMFILRGALGASCMFKLLFFNTFGKFFGYHFLEYFSCSSLLSPSRYSVYMCVHDFIVSHILSGFLSFFFFFFFLFCSLVCVMSIHLSEFSNSFACSDLLGVSGEVLKLLYFATPELQYFYF